MHKFFISLTIAALLMFSSNALAGGWGECPPGQEKKGWKCVDIEEPDDDGTVINNNNDNDNSNRNTNLNTNLNSQNQGQAQAQGQIQGQLQGQGQIQGQTAHNEGVEQSVTINEAEIPVTYNHITAPVGKTDANALDYDDKSMIRLESSILEYDDDYMLTISEARNASKGAKIKAIKALLWEADVELKEVNYVEISGRYMGSITLTTESASLDQMIAEACELAMKNGATSIKLVNKKAAFVSASKSGIDLGGAASIAVTPSGSVVMAPGATLGYSKAKTDNRFVPEVYVMLFHDASLIK